MPTVNPLLNTEKLDVTGISLEIPDTGAGNPHSPESSTDPSTMWGRVFDLSKKNLVDLGDFKLFAMADDYIGNSIITARVYEPHVTAVLKQVLKEGDVLLDLGANLGFFTMLGASLVKEDGKVIAFEPNVQNQQMIYSSLYANGFGNVEVFPFVVSDKKEIKKFVTVGSNGGVVTEMASIEALRNNNPEFSYYVQSVILDDILKNESRIDVIKMDIEAHEPYAFKGMKDLVKKHKPIILTEFHPWVLIRNNPEPPKEFLEAIVACGYALSIIPFSGEVVEAPDVDFVIKFWEDLSVDNPTIHLDLVAYPLQERLQTIVNNGKENKVTQLPQEINKTLPSNQTNNFKEMLGRKESYTQGQVAFQGRKIKLYTTPLGNYYLPTDVPGDVIIAAMREGRIFEPEVVATAKKYIRRGTVVLDLGANLGQMSLLFAEFAGETGHVYSFEADDVICMIFEKNVEINRRSNITPICKAVYDKNGDVMFYPEPDFSRFGSYGSYGLDPNAKTGRKVKTITVDSLNITQPISFMKVDVQGSDLFALRGARETIMRHRMPILFEFEQQFQKEFGTSLKDYMDFVESISYKVEKIIDGINYLIVPKELPQESEFKFNRILDNKARELYNPIIAKLFTLAPEMMARKIPEANVQQAFVLDTVERFAAGITNPRLLCVGCYEDTAVASLKVLGYRIDEIDPALNYDLNTFFNLPTTQKASYDIIFSTSVIEHVQDDESFVRQIEGLLAQGGVAIITCDYNDTYRPGDYIPQEDFRLYTQKDFAERLMPMIPNCTLVDTPQWDCPEPDFVYAGCHYTFATLVFRKDTDADECFETLKLPHDQTVIPLYQRLLGRQPDVDERYHWNEMLRLGISIDDFADALMANPEYWNKKANEKRILLSLPRFKMFVMKNDLDVGSCLFKTLDYEPHVSGVLIELLRPGSVFMDIGANIGYFSLLAASIVGKEGKVISFEPNMQNVQLLYASLLENGFTNVLVFPFAVSDTQQILKIKSMCSNGILERSSVGRENVQSTQSIIVDNLLQNEHKIDVVKIDIEGHEPFALKSMKRLLQQHHPTILTEFSPWHIKRQAKIEPEDYLKQIVNYGYSLAIISEDGGTLVKAPTTDYIMCTWRALNNDKRQLDVMARPV